MTNLDKYKITIVKTVDSFYIGECSSFEKGSAVDFTLFVSSNAEAAECEIVIADTAENIILTEKAQKISEEQSGAMFFVQIDTQKIAEKHGIGIYLYKFLIRSKAGCFKAKRESSRKTAPVAALPDGWDDAFLLSIYESEAPIPEWINGGIAYHIFIDRFCRRGDFVPRGDAILNSDWENGAPSYGEYPAAFNKNNVFFGGNFDGIISRLEYLSSLGVSCIFLSPIFESGTNHKFNTSDFMKIDDMFGGEAAFTRLVKAAGKRGIRIIIEVCFDITSDDSRYFNKYCNYSDTGAYNSKSSEYFDWYTFFEHPGRYECRFSIPSMPRLNLDSRAVKAFIAEEGGVAAYYAGLGIAGFRLCASSSLPLELSAEMKSTLETVNPDSVFYGILKSCEKGIIGASKSVLAHGADSLINYPIREAVIRFLRQGDYAALKDCAELIYEVLPPRAQNMLMNITGSYDTTRLLTALAGADGTGMPNAKLASMSLSTKEKSDGIQLTKLAYLILATLPGIPCIYYGDEAGMEGYGDPFNRRCFQWNKTQSGLYRHIRKVSALRKELRVYRDGAFVINFATEDIFIFSRLSAAEAAITVVNRSDRTYRITAKSEFVSMLINISKPATSIDIPPRCGTVLYSKFANDAAPCDFTVLRR